MSTAREHLGNTVAAFTAALNDPAFMEAVDRAGDAMTAALTAGGKILFFGNGGSAADAQHLAAELVGRFRRERRGLPAIALTTDTSVLTAIGNDYGFADVFRRQVEALGQSVDVAVGLSTSGNSENVLRAIEEARRMGIRTIGLTGGDGGRLASLCDIPIIAPSDNTAHVQEIHVAVGHTLCEIVDASRME